MRSRMYLASALALGLVQAGHADQDSGFDAEGAPAAGLRVEHQQLPASRRLEGLWSITVTPTVCETGEPAIPGFNFRVMNLFIRGGALVETNAGGAGNAPGEPPSFPLRGPPGGGPTERGTGFGTWDHVGGKSYDAVFVFFAHAPDGTAAGTHTIARAIRLLESANEFRARASVVVHDAEGRVTETRCAVESAQRMD